jgi:hypothetical protein
MTAKFGAIAMLTGYKYEHMAIMVWSGLPNNEASLAAVSLSRH